MVLYNKTPKNKRGFEMKTSFAGKDLPYCLFKASTGGRFDAFIAG
jgi:hypothetical protein